MGMLRRSFIEKSRESSEVLLTRPSKPRGRATSLLPPPKFIIRYAAIVVVVIFSLVLESRHHASQNIVARPAENLDEPYEIGCREPDVSNGRENGTLLMFAKNSDLEGAKAAMRSIEKQFNRFWHYPVLFMNDQPWEREFVDSMKEVVSGDASFYQIPSSAWHHSEWVDRETAVKHGTDGVNIHDEGYMSRFMSGVVYDMEPLLRYKYFWRIEPGATFTCTITHDPFVAMSKYGKVLGYTAALGGANQSMPSLWPTASNYKYAKGIASTRLWKSLVISSSAPLPLRWLLGYAGRERDANGDVWNGCHYGSNFEIADMDFFRTNMYREYFEVLDSRGGFHHERWSDAAVHSLAAAMFLEPEQLHHFAHIGYKLGRTETCPYNKLGGQMRGSTTLDFNTANAQWKQAFDDGIGCRCMCDPAKVLKRSVCMQKLREGVEDYKTSNRMSSDADDDSDYDSDR